MNSQEWEGMAGDRDGWRRPNRLSDINTCPLVLALPLIIVNCVCNETCRLLTVRYGTFVLYGNIFQE